MAYNHKTLVHTRTINVHDSFNISKARTEILNQCLKAFTLFMHNLTPTTAADVHCIFGEDGSELEGGNAESRAFLVDDGGEEEEAH